MLPSRVLVAVLSTFLALSGPGAPAAHGAQGEPQSTLRGELVRFADATVQVSVLVDRPVDVPEAIWDRVRSGGEAAYLPEGSAGLNEEVRRRLEEAVGVGGVRTVSQVADLRPFGVHASAEEGVRLVWYDLTEDEGVAILADARAADDGFTLRILIPNPNVTEEDWWGLQAALSRVGIRRVQILGGGVP